MAETKPKPAESLRTPGPKKKLGLTVPHALRLPHDDLIGQKERVPEESIASMARQTTHHLESPPSPVSPQRDYAKVANSITRQAVPAGAFKGKSKQLYDALYSLTRGSVHPSRTVRISRPNLMRKAHIGSRATFDSNITHLLAVGLIKVRLIIGEHEGNQYEVLLPEEAQSSIPSLTSQTSLTGYAQKLVRLVRLETSQTRHTLNAGETRSSTKPKTSFKTIERSDDDEAGAAIVRELRKMIQEVSGRQATSAEIAKLIEVIEVLTLEAKIAAARTTVSSVGPFLAEHLRRRLFKKDKQQIAAESAKDEPPAPAVDAAGCPDCAGVGWYYPEGKEKGMAKCRHARLTASEIEHPGLT